MGVRRGPQVNQQNNNNQQPQNNNNQQQQIVLGVQIPQDQRQWSVNVLRVLGWSSKQQEHQKLNNDITGLLQQDDDEPSDIVNQMQVAFQELSNSLDQNGIWNSTEEMKASQIKATLAFERMPNKQARLQTGSANPTFWVDGPPDPNTNETRQYIFKPAMKGALMTGMSDGGEPTREALAGRVSEMLQAYSGLDFNMPLTNVISVDRTRLNEFHSDDPGSQIVEGNTVSGSLQQFKPSDGDLRANLCTRKGDVDPQSCQNVAMLDTIMLNLDRHDGNLLMGKDDTGLIPIDHGLSFPDTSVLETTSITDNMAGEKNVLLRLPGSYEAFSQESLEGLDKLDPSVLVGALKGEIVKMEQLHEGTQGTVTQSSLSITELTTRFLKRAAPTLAPAVLQMALGANARKLLDPEFGRDQNAWNNLADQVIQEFAAKAAQLKEFWMLPGDERDAIMNKLVADNLINGHPIEYRLDPQEHRRGPVLRTVQRRAAAGAEPAAAAATGSRRPADEGRDPVGPAEDHSRPEERGRVGRDLEENPPRRRRGRRAAGAAPGSQEVVQDPAGGPGRDQHPRDGAGAKGVGGHRQQLPAVLPAV